MKEAAQMLQATAEVCRSVTEVVHFHGTSKTRLADNIEAVLAHNKQLGDLLQQMLFVAENADETGYVADVGFVDLDKLHAEVRAALGGDPEPTDDEIGEAIHKVRPL